ncbi:SOS response-associated peptidase [Paenibacillus sp. A3M_27_13]|uniref:SOS response-associated peptidase n=1 Tax=Paenibacillus sp. A3M_27_13 TaxID=2962029 RepID=UPI0020B7D9A8|nr:SOS response-associated peptidase [Paenibacillus sp. A3M_27_13]MCP3746601.1 SOS response-associated peptidase [Paenibacillus sp. A3M_27_13]
MCGRFTLAADKNDVMDTFSVEDMHYEHTPRYNIAPSQTIAVINNNNGRRVLDGYRWGLVPRWAKDMKIGFSMINARAETLDTKPAFRNLLAKNRVVIPADGFYEWLKEDDGKQPYRFVLKEQGVFGFAGLYDEWKDSKGDILRSCTIITTQPNELVQYVHDRMPVILDKEAVDEWLDPGISKTEHVLEMLRPYPAGLMNSYPVSKAVGNVRSTDAGLIEEVPINSK